MQAIILAAGMGRRLKDLTADNTKCMVKVNGVRLIDRVLHQLERQKLSRIVIVVGYEGQKLIDYISTLDIQTPIVYVNNPIYDKTNNIYSLALAKDYLTEEDTLLLESDLIFEDSVLDALVQDERDTLVLVDKYECWMDGTVIKIGTDDQIQAFVPGKNFVFNDIPEYYKTVNIYKFSREFSANKYVPFLQAYTSALGNNEYYEQVLRVIAMLDDPGIRAKRLNGQKWYEIDDIQDLDIAESMFAEDDDERLDRIQSRFGGYWRYPKLLDFCYLVNPYYPPQKMMDEMKANFEKLLTQYPSGMRVNSLLAGKNFGVPAAHILVGNGAAELIKAMMERFKGNVGFIRPTFEEYTNRFPKERSIVFVPQNDDFSYGLEDITGYFADKKLEALVLINPDNPTGNYLPKEDMKKLAGWCEEKGIRLIADESFVDFAEEEDPTLIDEEILQRYPHLIVIKSISKSYGVPGIRLGVLAAADEELIALLKKEVAIWNINSFGEFWLQIAEKYRKSYKEALVRFRKARREMIEGLESVPGIRVFPTQANYMTVELTNGMTSRELTKKLLVEKQLFVKDLTSKMKNGRQYLRFAVRRTEENEQLISALKEYLK